MDQQSRRLINLGYLLVGLFLPLGLTLEALHALKVPVYLESPMRRELWTLAHAHGILLGVICLLMGATSATLLPNESSRPGIVRWLSIGALAMPLGFLLGGVLNHEGDPSLFILMVPLGGLCLFIAMLQAYRSGRT